jgi:hypothetical protein
MNEPPEELGALIARARDAGPGPERLARVRARLESQVGPIDPPRAAPGGLAPAAALGPRVGALVVVALLGIGAWLGTRAPSVEPSREPVTAAALEVAPPARAPERTIDAPVVTTPAPAVEAATPAPPAETEDAIEPRRAARTAPSAPSEPPAEVDPGSSLREEIALLDRALRASEAGDPARARAALDEHRARFPSGTLSPERDRMLRELGDRATPPSP